MTTPRFSRLARRVREARRDPVTWAAYAGIRLRPYQAEIARAIQDSVLNGKGLTFVVILPRQSGKNEVQRHLFGWLLLRAEDLGGTIVSVAPTFKPQTLNAMQRIRLALDSNRVTRGLWSSAAGFMFQFGKARLQFFSGESHAHVVGATADLLLSVDEAQDIPPAKFDKDFDPMTASTNATRVFWGTAWTSQTLLARQMRICREQEQQDGIRRLFYYTADDVARLVPEYAAHVRRVVQERGREHPLVKTQYFNEEIDAQAGMFNAGRMALLFPTQNQEPAAVTGTAGSPAPIAFLIDVAGMDESHAQLSQFGELGNPGRDSTTLSIVEVDLSTLQTLQAPTYRVVGRAAWQGLNHLTVFGKLKALAEDWRPQHIVIDATGVGEGLWAMLDKAFRGRVIPVKFTQLEKSEIGWRFLSIIETGRFRADPHPQPLSHEERGIGGVVNPETVRLQYALCRSEILPGPAKILRWGVPDGTRGPDGELVHDDFVVADALVARLDPLEWSIRFKTVMIPPKDPLAEMSRIR